MSAMDQIRAKRGMISKIAAKIGVTRGAVAQWTQVPMQHVPAVSVITGITQDDLCKELWETADKKRRDRAEAADAEAAA